MEEFYKGNIEEAVKDYFKHSWLYYIKDSPVVGDTHYDHLCRYLYNNYDKISTEYKNYVIEDDLRAGTGAFITMKQYEELGYK